MTRHKTTFQLDPELWAQIKASAARDTRSLNGQVNALLKEALAAREKAEE